MNVISTKGTVAKGCADARMSPAVQAANPQLHKLQTT